MDSTKLHVGGGSDSTSMGVHLTHLTLLIHLDLHGCNTASCQGEGEDCMFGKPHTDPWGSPDGLHSRSLELSFVPHPVRSMTWHTSNVTMIHVAGGGDCMLGKPHPASRSMGFTWWTAWPAFGVEFWLRSRPQVCMYLYEPRQLAVVFAPASCETQPDPKKHLSSKNNFFGCSWNSTSSVFNCTNIFGFAPTISATGWCIMGTLSSFKSAHNSQMINYTCFLNETLRIIYLKNI